MTSLLNDLQALQLRRLLEAGLPLAARPYQVLAEKSPPGFAQVTKYVVGTAGRVLRY